MPTLVPKVRQHYGVSMGVSEVRGTLFGVLIIREPCYLGVDIRGPLFS